MKNLKANYFKNEQKKKTLAIIVSVVSFVLLISVIVLTIFLVYSNKNLARYENSLENIYQRSYYNFTDNINNMEVSLSKVLSSSEEDYCAELLEDIAKNAQNAQSNISLLPISINGIFESISFINQLSGYCETLSKNIIKGKSLTTQEKETLQLLYNSILVMKNSLNDLSQELLNENILEQSQIFDGDLNNFSLKLQTIKSNDIDYPTMIYDGPFADSQISKVVKSLANSNNVVSAEQAKEKLSELFNISIEKINYNGETNSNFETYNFVLEDSNKGKIFAQMSKKEGCLITMSRYINESEPTLNIIEAENLSKQFIINNGINNIECVWYDVIGGIAYFNFAAMENDIILYPDLIKVKCSLSDGKILGYEARSYYTNHIGRNLEEFVITKEIALSKIKEGYIVENVAKVLAPIDYSEILCYEIKCDSQNETYYFYINAVSGEIENILKVIRTNEGNMIL